MLRVLGVVGIRGRAMFPMCPSSEAICYTQSRMTESVVASFRQLVSAGNRVQLDLVLVLGLTGPRNISQFSDMVRAAGLRESAARAYSTTTLRPILKGLAKRGLVVDTDTGFDCAPFARELVLRDAAERGVLDHIAAAVRSIAFPYLRYSTRGNEAAWFDFRVAIQRRDLNAASDSFSRKRNPERYPIRDAQSPRGSRLRAVRSWLVSSFWRSPAGIPRLDTRLRESLRTCHSRHAALGLRAPRRVCRRVADAAAARRRSGAVTR